MKRRIRSCLVGVITVVTTGILVSLPTIAQAACPTAIEYGLIA